MTAPSPPVPILRARNLSKSFGENHVLNGIDLDIAAGEVLCLIGPSGSGKSTLLRTLATLDRPDGGVIFFNNAPLGVMLKKGRLFHASEKQARRERDRIGFVFQQFNLFPHLTALQNVTLAPSLLGAGRAVRQRGLDLLEKVGLAHKADAYPGELSGGQQQRVAIARTLAREPQLILFDEPTSALDPELVGEVLATIAELAATGITMAIATHEMGFARRVADHVAFLDHGRIVEYGPPAQVLDNPQEARTREFLHQIHAH
ncbi:amino acid ABC transporter ATP-binding protein (plasmid) [Erwinia rhapontici]|uniref:amino acid ABC transporter ATP-binding protein n=1 Tax=Erwinia rhapontici TaxID=55212 RepID=UPI002413465B|nr:amino acid ABC transporter ATP-binding protein [Erwinia rhapontici]NKG29378.1 amino acid ABC transporter ATP-binding protein [Erwinia rhapontici]